MQHHKQPFNSSMSNMQNKPYKENNEMRKTIDFSEDVHQEIQMKRARALMQNTEITYTEMVNRLLRCLFEIEKKDKGK